MSLTFSAALMTGRGCSTHPRATAISSERELYINVEGDPTTASIDTFCAPMLVLSSITLYNLGGKGEERKSVVEGFDADGAEGLQWNTDRWQRRHRQWHMRSAC